MLASLLGWSAVYQGILWDQNIFMVVVVETLSINILPTNEAIIDHLQCKQQSRNYNPRTD